MNAEIVVREALPEDAAGIARVHIASWRSAYAHVFPAEALRGLATQEARRAEQWAARLRGSAARRQTLVAISEGDPIGFVDGGPARDDDVDATRVGELAAIYVTPGAWGEGAGQRLMAAFLERLRSAGFDEAVLWVLDDNPQARRFYEAAGWALDGAVKDDELLGTPVREVRYRIALTPITGAVA